MRAQHSAPRNQETDLAIVDVRFEHLSDALGVGTSQPRLLWIVTTSARGWIQAAYEVEAYRLDGRLHEETGRIESDQSVLVPWAFSPLSSRERRLVRVRVWGIDGRASAWSAPYLVEAGLLAAADWTARFGSHDRE